MKPLSIDGVVMNTWRQAVGKGHNVAAVGKLTCAGDLTGLGEVMDDITFYKADITNKEFIEHIFNKEKPEVIVHFSAEN
ncbi:NAD-dependent epimerase/dehydratase family protein [Coprothermobacter platensis]|uniref:NAD-dependent epimerase/dehydratase family protein n=1 Tax=Coprothermobacter platensis TaxID=108819 RepID=UPI001FE0FE4E|nr:NAD-dependent epimerase/dehydratase family protein [Coprothermobacter platensis]